MLQGFKDFLFRGNIIDLAVAVVIGTAFTALVAALTTAVIQPIINVAGGSGSDGIGFEILSGTPSTYVNISLLINALITFIITAAVVYFVFVLPTKKLMERLAAGEEDEPEGPSEDILLLREIRDALGGSARQRTTGDFPDA